MKPLIVAICLFAPLVSGLSDFEKCVTSKITFPTEWAEEPIKVTTKLQTPVKVIYIEETNKNNHVQGACPSHEICANSALNLLRNIRRNSFDAEENTEFDWNFLVGFAGEVFVGKSFEGSVPQTLNHDDIEKNSGIRIGIIGGGRNLPLPRVWASVRNLINCGIKQGLIDPNYTLRANHECDKSYGKRFLDIVKSLHVGEELRNTFECVDPRSD